MSINKLPHACAILMTIFASKGAIGADRIAATKPVVAQLPNRPLSFEPNRGQTDKQVDFLAHGAGYGLYLSHSEAVMVLGPSATVRLRPAAANVSAVPEGIDEQRSKTNYFIGKVPEQWRTGIPNFAKVRYRNVYSGVDLIYYGKQKQLEYDFVVNPSGDPGKILLEFTGVDKTGLDDGGDFVLNTAAGDLRWHKPIAYQEVDGGRRQIGCAYVRKDTHHLAFRLDAYDRTKPLVIDPVLDYSTYLGGSGDHGDTGRGIAVDKYGNVYVTGETESPDFPTKNPFQKRLKGSVNTSNAFVTKIDATDCALVYSTYLGGSDTDSGAGIALDALGNAYVTGSTSSPDFPITQTAFQKSLKGSSNAFVTKLDAAGNALLYSTYLGGSGYDQAAHIAVDAHDNAYVTGTISSADFPTQHAFQEKLGSAAGNAFVTKLDAAGTGLVYSTYLGGSGGGEGDVGDVGSSIAVDAHENAYVTGTTSSFDFPTHKAFQPKKLAPLTAFVTKFDATGTGLIYSTFLGGSRDDQGSGIAVDADENAYVTGRTGSVDFPTKKPFQSKLKNGEYSAFVTKLDAAGTALVYSTYLGGNKSLSLGSFGIDIAVGTNENAYVSGLTTDTDFPVKCASQERLKGDVNGFVTKFDAAGTALVYSSYLGGSANDAALAIAVDHNGNAYVTGYTGSPDFPVKNAFQKKLKGSTNAFVTKINAR